MLGIEAGLVAAAALSGACWRRWFGLGHTGPRWIKLLAGSLLLGLLTAFVLPWWGSLAIGVAGVVYFIPGHRWDDNWAIFWRYFPYGWVYMIFRNVKTPVLLGGWIDGGVSIAEHLIGAAWWATLAGIPVVVYALMAN